MSVDYYSCRCCGESRYEEAVAICEECGRWICCDCLVNADEYEAEFYFPEEVMNEDWEIKKEFCPLCTKTKIADSDLLKYIINKYNLDRSELEKEYKSE